LGGPDHLHLLFAVGWLASAGLHYERQDLLQPIQFVHLDHEVVMVLLGPEVVLEWGEAAYCLLEEPGSCWCQEAMAHCRLVEELQSVLQTDPWPPYSDVFFFELHLQ